MSASFFGFFDARPALGRFFLAAEDTTPVGASVAVLDYGFWKSDFGGRNVLGEPIQVGNITATIIGVAPRGFTGVAEDEAPAVYIPITAYAGNLPGEDGKNYFIHYHWGWMNMMVRRKADVSLAAANADLTNAFARSWNAERGENRSLEPVSEARPQRYRVIAALRGRPRSRTRGAHARVGVGCRRRRAAHRVRERREPVSRACAPTPA